MIFKIPIYLDHHATTPVDPRVFGAMKPYFSEIFGNPASSTHSFGWMAEEAVRQAREKVAKLIGAQDPKEIIWTSGTTESINLALVGAALKLRETQKKNHIISCVIEHKAVLETLEYLQSLGFEVTLLPVDSQGLLDPAAIKKVIRPQTALISLMAANNEIGVIHPISEVGKIAKEAGVLFHVDAAQACGKIPIHVEEMGIDLLSMSAHKVYGPKGTGALYVRSRHPSVILTPILYGGDQEKGLRPGTLAVQNIVGMGEAFTIAESEMKEESKRLLILKQRLYQGLQEKIDNVFLNGHPSQRLSGNLNVSFPDIKASDLLAKVRDVAFSSGSACASGSLEPSYVIRALGVGEERARSSIRIGLGRFNTEEEIDFAAEKIAQAIKS